jgi:DsbC/DsbD-like thiol-disulfide interchange protein
VAPVFDWSGSENLKSIEVDWPSPEVFSSFGTLTIGYRSDVTLPVRIVAIDAAAPVGLKLSLSYGVCSNICMPEKVDVALDIAPDARIEEPALMAATLSLPIPAREAGLTSAACQIAGAGEERRFSGAFQFTQGFDEAPIVVVEGQSDIWIAPTSVAQDGGALTVGADVELASPDTWIDRGALRVTFLTPYEALDLRGCEG